MRKKLALLSFFIGFLLISGMAVTNKFLSNKKHFVEYSYVENENKKFIRQSIEYTIKRKRKNANTDYVRCMADNIYFEAGREPFMGQVMVARVVMNRIKHGFAKNPCSVIYQEAQIETDTESFKRVCQFSWVCENKEVQNRNSPVYKQAEEIARLVITENAWSETVSSDILFFHNTTVSPQWKYQRVAQVGNHVFYSK